MSKSASSLHTKPKGGSSESTTPTAKPFIKANRTPKSKIETITLEEFDDLNANDAADLFTGEKVPLHAFLAERGVFPKESPPISSILSPLVQGKTKRASARRVAAKG
jgi:hypothetical protein